MAPTDPHSVAVVPPHGTSSQPIPPLGAGCTDPQTWRECADAGMSLADAARHLGKSPRAASAYAKKHGLRFAYGYGPNAARMKALNADPEFAAKHAAKSSARMKALNADPEFNPLAALTDTERNDYDTLVKRGGYNRNEALAAIGRADLVKP